MGATYESQGRLRDALEMQQRALSLREELGDASLLADSLAQLGSIHDAMGKGPEALELLERVLEIRDALGDPIDIARAQRALARTLWQYGDKVRAVELLEAAVATYRERKRHDDVIRELETLIRLYDLSGAKDHARAATDELRRLRASLQP